MKFYIVDAFTDALFGGNPAGVVILDRGADFPAEETMCKTAAELRYSETAFIKQTGENLFQVRYFTPASEVDLCGHATIGSAFALADAGLVRFGSAFTFHTLAGSLNINLTAENAFMDMAAPEDLDKITDQDALRELYAVMGLDGEEVMKTAGEKGAALIPEIISTGLPDILLPVRDEKELAAIAPDFRALSALSEKYNVVGIHAFAVNTQDGAVHCRNFAPLYGIDEEAATGTSNGALTYYLYKNGLLRAGTENLFLQGEAMGRPSRILSRLTAVSGKADSPADAAGTGGAAGTRDSMDDDASDDVTNAAGVRIQIGGSAVILARGEINL